MASNGTNVANDNGSVGKDSQSTRSDSPKLSPTSTRHSRSSSSLSLQKDHQHQHHHSHHVLGSLFGRHGESHNSIVGRDSALGHMLAPALQVAGAHNPFTISALCEDGSRKKTHTYGKFDKEQSSAPVDRAGPDDAESVAASEDTAGSEKRKSRKRDRIRSAFGRSLSPWRYHNIQERKSNSGASNLSRQSRDSLDVQREKTARGLEDADAESDGESVHSGIVPRNSAFGSYDSESEDEMDVPHHHRRNPPEGGKAIPVDSNEGVPRDETAAKGEKDGDEESQGESADAREEREEDEDSDDYIDFDEETLDNTLFNAGCIDLHDAWLKDDYAPTQDSSDRKKDHHHDHHHHAGQSHAHYGPEDYDAAWHGAGPSGHDENDEGLRAPNVVIGQSQSMSPSEIVGEGMDILSVADEAAKSSPTSARFPTEASAAKASQAPSTESHGKSSATTIDSKDTKTTRNSAEATQKLTASRPVFEKNRCTITLVHSEYDRFAKESKRPRRYIVASDGSEESSYAIEWTIGTVLRDGDEMLVVSVMETDTKLDSSDPKHEDKKLRQEHQRIRQSMAVILARRAVAVLQRTRLAVRISCQALHARNSRHMFIDMIDFFEPTMCVVGSRGLGSLKGVLLGSFSHYCVQKSPVPVMVARKRLKLPPLPKGKVDVVSNVRARHMRLDQAMIEKTSSTADDGDEAEGEKKEEEEEGEVGGKEGEKQEDQKVAEPSGIPTAETKEQEVLDQKPANEGDTKPEASEKEKEKIVVEQEAEAEAIKRDAERATELQEKEKEAAAKKQAKMEKEAAKEESQSGGGGGGGGGSTRGRKLFSIGGGPGADEEEGEEARGRSRSRASDRSDR